MIEQLVEANLIGEGRYRLLYRAENYAVKVLKNHVRKHFGSFSVSVPLSLDLFFKFGTVNLNCAEQSNYIALMQRVPEELADSFGKILWVDQTNSVNASICALVADADGTPSKTLKQSGIVESSAFWKRMNALETFFIESGAIYSEGEPANILVRQLPCGEALPVIVDYKRICMSPYLARFWQGIDTIRRQRIKRKFAEFKRKYQSECERCSTHSR